MQPPVSTVSTMEATAPLQGPGLALVGLVALGVVVTTVLLRKVARAPALQRWARWCNPVIAVGWASLAVLAIWRIVATADSVTGMLARALVVVLAIATGGPLARDLFGAAVIGIEGRHRVGDDVRVGVHEGRIASLGLRAVVLRSDDGSEIEVRNQHFLASDVVRLTTGRALVEFEIGVPPSESLQSVTSRLVDAALISPLAAPGALPEVFVTSADARGAVVRVRAYVFDREYAPRYRSDILARLGSGSAGSSDASSDAVRHID